MRKRRSWLKSQKVSQKVNLSEKEGQRNKEIKTESFRNWEGISQKMLAPVSHLDDCNYNHYNLQLSIYMYIILKHNPTFKPGKLILHHIQFEEEDQRLQEFFST